MKKTHKILNLLRDPAWTFASCLLQVVVGIVTLVGIVGVSSLVALLIGKFKIFMTWLFSPVPVLWIYILVFLILFLLTFLWAAIRLIQNKKFRPKNTNPKHHLYYEFWNVLWKATLSAWEKGAVIEGPFCSQHNFELEILYDDLKHNFSFKCPGIPEEGRHIIKGPKYKELIVPVSMVTINSSTDLFYYDIRKRVESEWRKEGRF
jgi:hypothetical protein